VGFLGGGGWCGGGCVGVWGGGGVLDLWVGGGGVCWGWGVSRRGD